MNHIPNLTELRTAQDVLLVGGQELRDLQYFGRLQNVKIINAKANPFDGKLNLKYTPDSPVATSALGTPVYSDLTILGLSYTDNVSQQIITLKNDRFRTGDAGSGELGNPNGLGSGYYMNFQTVLITVNQVVNVVKTKIQGLDGTVKEYIGLDDATITINGIITGQNGVYPLEEVNRLRAWLKAPVSKSIVARWLGNMGIDNIVVDSWNIPQTEGGYSYQMFSIQASSDLPVELKITVPVM